MFYLLILCVVIGVVSVATIYVIDEPGFIMLQWGVWQVELSLVLGMLLIVLVTLILFVGLEVLTGIVRIPGRLGRSYREYREQKKYAASVKGLKHLLLGEWAKAEQLLDASAPYLPQPVISYLAAAYAAQKQDNIVRRDKYLNKARELNGDNKGLVSLISCRLRMAYGETGLVVDELKKLCAQMPKNAQAFDLLADAYEKLENWEALESLLPHLQKTRARSAEDIRTLTATITGHRLRKAQHPTELQSIWKGTANSVQMNPDVTIAYIRKLFQYNRHQEVDKVIRGMLAKRWDSELAYLYGLVNGQVEDRHLYDVAHKWLESHPDDPDLLLTAGRLARRAGRLKNAEAHLKKSVELGGRREAYEELGGLLEEQHAAADAFNVYKAGTEAPASRPQTDSQDSAG